MDNLENEEDDYESSEQENENEDDDDCDMDSDFECYIPQVEYSATCNADMMPMVCNEFVTEFLDKEHGACVMDRAEAIDLTRNLNAWLVQQDLTCCHVSLYY